MAAQKHQGTCKWFNSKKGFGFITPADGSTEVFVHQSAIQSDGFRSLAEKEPVEYELDQDDNQRSKAINVTGPSGAAVKGAPKPRPRYHLRKGAQQGGDANHNDGGHENNNNSAPATSSPVTSTGNGAPREPRQRRAKAPKNDAAPANKE